MRQLPIHILFICSIIGIIAAIFIFVSPTVFADDPNSASTAAKINQLTDEISSRAAQLKSQVDKTIENKVVAGKIKSIKGDKFTVTTFKGERTVEVNQFTVYKSDPNSGDKKLNIADIHVGSSVAALGDLDDKGVLNAKQMVKSSSDYSFTPTKFIWGVIEKISSNNIKIQNQNKKTSGILIDNQTKFQSSNEDIKISDLKTGFTILILQPKKQSTPSSFIYLTNQIKLHS